MRGQAPGLPGAGRRRAENQLHNPLADVSQTAGTGRFRRNRTAKNDSPILRELTAFLKGGSGEDVDINCLISKTYWVSMSRILPIQTIRPLSMKSNRSFWFYGHFQHLLDRRKYHVELRVVSLFHLLYLLPQFFMGDQHFSEPHEGAHDRDIYLDRAFTPKNAGQHRHALLRESERP